MIYEIMKYDMHGHGGWIDAVWFKKVTSVILGAKQVVSVCESAPCRP